jgi:hypothetical protein
MEDRMEQEAMPQTAETTVEGGTNAVAKVERKPAQLIASEGVLAILPRSVEEAARYADGLIKGGLVPDSFKQGGQINASQVMMGVLKAMELEIPPQTGLAGLYVVNNRFSVFGDLAQALVHRTGKVANHTTAWIGPAFDEDLPLGEWPVDFGCEVRFWRVGQPEPYVGRYTVRDAKRAGLWMKRDPWVRYPKRMLFNRARAFALRDGFADGLHGLSIAEEVMDALPPVEEDARKSENLAALTADEGEDLRAGSDTDK